MKLQELLDKYKESIWNGAYSIHYSEGVLYEFDIDGCPWGTMSLSDLLFSTPFLGMLKWINTPTDVHIICGDYNMYRDDGVYEQIEERLSEVEYQKLQLAMLATDKERVDYIEQNTI